jgi:hypothetical protein
MHLLSEAPFDSSIGFKNTKETEMTDQIGGGVRPAGIIQPWSVRLSYSDVVSLVLQYDIIHEGFSTVSRTCVEAEDGQPTLLAVKSSSTLRKFAKEPHDIVKELRLLSLAQHPNVCV